MRTEGNSNLRSEVDRLLEDSKWVSAAARLRDVWRAESSSASAAFVVSRFEKLREKISLLPFRVAILRSFTVEPIVPLLRAEASYFGIDLTVHIGDSTLMHRKFSTQKVLCTGLRRMP